MNDIRNIGGNNVDWNSFFQSVYKTYYSRLCVFACGFLQNENDAEEIVQNVILKLWEQKDKINEIENMQAYLFRSVKNQCLNFIKRNKLADVYKTEAWKELKELEEQTMSNTQPEDNEQQIKQLKEAIETLPERCQEVLKMSKFEGLKNKEIADELQISLKAVEANISRAFTLIRKNFQKNKEKNNNDIGDFNL
ncbi:MAG: RNA polymerase sigma-70 factor [Bacteroidales bacterium]|nr:RNA polymerase sigma-70 factor [Bacteroidales bacterium]